MTYANFCFEQLYGEDSLESKEMGESVLDLLRSMFKEYASRFGGDATRSSQSKKTSSVSVQETQEQMGRLAMVVEDFGYERMDNKYT